MLMPSIFTENLFDDWFDFPAFPDVDRKLYGKNAAREMRRGGILVAPSRWEGSPYAVLEALAQGMKVLASDCPGNRDLVQPPTNGWLFPVDDVDALADLLVRV